MVISASQFSKLVQPGLRVVFDTSFRPMPPLFDPDWLKTYEAEYDKITLIRRAELKAAAWEAWLSKHTPSVRERLERLNPTGVEEGHIPRGWNRRDSGEMWALDLITAEKYQLKWGFWPTVIAKKSGRKKYVTRVDYLDGTGHAMQRCVNQSCCHQYGHRGACDDIPF